jgi:hypothetical protein
VKLGELRRTVAVDDLSFTVRPGMVTGFLGTERGGQDHHHELILGRRQPARRFDLPGDLAPVMAWLVSRPIWRSVHGKCGQRGELVPYESPAIESGSEAGDGVVPAPPDRRPGKIAAWNVYLESVDTSCGPPTRRSWARGIAIA